MKLQQTFLTSVFSDICMAHSWFFTVDQQLGGHCAHTIRWSTFARFLKGLYFYFFAGSKRPHEKTGNYYISTRDKHGEQVGAVCYPRVPGHPSQPRWDFRSSPLARRFARKGCRSPGTSGGVARGSSGYRSSRTGGSIWWSQPANNQTRNISCRWSQI